jgi:hypothetical protein
MNQDMNVESMFMPVNVKLRLSVEFKMSEKVAIINVKHAA